MADGSGGCGDSRPRLTSGCDTRGEVGVLVYSLPDGADIGVLVAVADCGKAVRGDAVVVDVDVVVVVDTVTTPSGRGSFGGGCGGGAMVVWPPVDR